MNKKAVKYLRFSSDEQSHFSIERQEMITSSWMNHANVELVDSFEDRGYSATNFDRPDFKKLYSFIGKNYRNIDYLVVSDLTRFSREAGDALNIVKKIQTTYGIKIVSAGRATVYDCTDHSSFFMMGLEFLLGNTENLKRANDINGGIYTAKAIKHRYIGPRAPFGYRREGKGENSRLVVVEDEARVVRFIYDAYLRNVPQYVIEMDAKSMGLRKTGNSIIELILTCPIYTSHQWVKPYKDQPGGLFPIKDQEPIIDFATWTAAQEKLKKKVPARVSVSEEMPLRGVLYCHCGRLLTGAPSRGRRGAYFYYYKCQVDSKHNNISVKKSHEQLLEAFQYMSLSSKMIKSITMKSEAALEARMEDQGHLLTKRRNELQKVEIDLRSLEQKWIEEKVTFDTYNRWYNDYNKQRNFIKSQIDQLGKNHSDTHRLLAEHIGWLRDVRHLYETANLLQKQEMIRAVFDNSLYYQDKVYRTPYLIPELSHNELIMREKNLLYIEKKRDFLAKIPSGGGEGTRTPVQTQPPKAFYMLIPALLVGRRPGPDKPTSSLAV